MDMEKLIAMLDGFRHHGIRADAQKTVDFQDIVGRATYEQVHAAYAELDPHHQELFIWACTAALSFEMAYTIIKNTICAKYILKIEEKLSEEYNDRHAELDRRDRKIAEQEKRWVDVERKQKAIQNILKGGE